MWRSSVRACGEACLGGLLASIPAALRVTARCHCAAPGILAVLGMAALVPMLVVILVLRGARSGAVQLELSMPRLTATLAVWAALLVPTLAVLGTLLRARTHNHALAGVTFAVVALASGAMALPIGCRAADTLGARFSTFAALAVVLLVGAVLTTAGDPVGLDAFVFLAVAAAVAFGARGSRAGLVGAPLMLLLVGLGVWTMTRCPTLPAAMATAAPAYAVALAPWPLH